MERRRGARIPARFRLQISGVDDRPVLRRGDISMSGAYVELARRVGRPGSVQRLAIASDGNRESVELLARVVRVVSIQDLWHDGAGIAGVAFEFLPEAAAKREALTQIIRQVMASRSYTAESVRMGPGFEAQVPAPGEPCTMGVRVMVLETDWPVAVGDVIRCELSGAGRRACLRGRVVQCTEERRAASACYRVELDFERPARQASSGEPTVARSISDAMDSLLEDVVFPAEGATNRLRGETLTGSLERVPLAELLALCEVEQLTGTLRVTHDTSSATVWVRDGRIVDVEADPGPDAPRDALALLCSFAAGEIDFTPDAVERPDRVSASIAELLANPG